MATNKQIDILFGVAGGGDIAGISGSTIAGQLNAIAIEISKPEKCPKITLGLNVAGTKTQIIQQLNSITSSLYTTNKYDMFSGMSTGAKQTGVSIDALQTKLTALYNTMRSKNFGSDADILSFKNADLAKIDNYRLKAITLFNEIKTAAASPVTSQNATYIQTLITKYEELISVERQELIQSSKVTGALDSQGLSYIKLANNISTYIAKYEQSLKKKAQQQYQQLVQLQQQLQNGTFVGKPGLAKGQFEQLQLDARAAGGEVETLGMKIKGLFNSRFGYMFSHYPLIYAFQLLRNIYTNVTEIDSALTQLSIVSGKSTTTLRDGLKGVADSAREANTSIKEMLKSMETYARLGYNLDDSEYMSKITNMYANVANTDTDTATSSLTAILKGFKYEAKDLESIADMLVKVGQEYAISAEELGTGLQTAGATLSVTGTDLEKSIALLTAGNAAMQDADKVATALKTSALRLQGTEASISELEEMGEDVSDLAEGTSKLRAEIKALSGVDIMISDTQYKDMYDVYVELAQVWDELSQTQRNTILEDLAGKRNSSVIASIILNLKDLEGAYESASNAGGTLATANDIYSQSIQGHINDLKTTFAEFSTNLLDSGVVKGVVDIANGFTTFLNVIVKFLSVGDGFIGQLALITAGLWALNAAMTAFNTQTGIFASTGEPIEALTYHAREYSGGDTERVNKIIVLFIREYLEKPTSLGLTA